MIQKIKHAVFLAHIKRGMAACLLPGLIFLFGCAGNETGEIKHISTAESPMLTVQLATPVPTAVPSPTPVPTDTPAPIAAPTPAPTTEAEGWIASLSIEEKLGQLVMFGFSGTESVSSEFQSLMRRFSIGNVILYGANIDKERSDGGFARCLKLTESLRDLNASKIPLLIAIDVEGGDVTRFHWEEKLLSAAALGKKNNPDLAETQFTRVGSGLAGVGIDLDLAPVMDIAKNPSATFLDDRIISSSAEVAGEIGAACIRGLHSGGCLSMVKHFPGHGATENDSHKTTPVIKKTLAELEEYELIPFAAAIEAGTDGVMVGHLYYPNIDPDAIASQSYFFITDLLREQMGFTGIVMSDDFRMEGLRQQCPLKEAAVNFILAGGDIILCGPNHDYQREIMQGLREACETGLLTEERIDESLTRIFKAKQSLQ